MNLVTGLDHQSQFRDRPIYLKRMMVAHHSRLEAEKVVRSINYSTTHFNVVAYPKVSRLLWNSSLAVPTILSYESVSYRFVQ